MKLGNRVKLGERPGFRVGFDLPDSNPSRLPGFFPKISTKTLNKNLVPSEQVKTERCFQVKTRRFSRTFRQPVNHRGRVWISQPCFFMMTDSRT